MLKAELEAIRQTVAGSRASLKNITLQTNLGLRSLGLSKAISRGRVSEF